MRTLPSKVWTAFVAAMALSAMTLQAQFTFVPVPASSTLLHGTLVTNVDQGSYTLEGGGADIWDVEDDFDFAYIQVTGDFDVAVRLDSIEASARWTKAGIMARETLDANSRFAFSKGSPAGTLTTPSCDQTAGAADVSFMYRTWIPNAGSNGGQHEDRLVADPGYPNYKWVRLQREGNIVRGYTSTDGTNWLAPVVQNTANWVTPINGTPTPLAQDLYLGLAVSRHGCAVATDLATVEFRNLQQPQILTQPQDVSTTKGRTATFRVHLGGLAQWQVQWYQGTQAIPDATNHTYSFVGVPLSASGQKFSARATDLLTGQQFTSTEATLTVADDAIKPTILGISAPAPVDKMFIAFSEDMNPSLATDPVNYTVTPVGGTALAVASAVLQADARTVQLNFDPATPLATGTSYNVTVASVADVAGNVLDTVTLPFETLVQSCPFPFLLEVYPTGGGTAVSVLKNHPSYPNYPDQTRLLNVFDTGADFRDNYGARVSGYFVPPTTGNYMFFLHSDDASELYLNTNGPSATGTVKIAEETGCCNAWPSKRSALIPLEGGKPYYIEGIYKEGGGGDYIRVAASLNGDTGSLTAIPAPQFATHGAGGSVTIVQSPANASLTENAVASFSVQATNTFGVRQCYVWQSSTDGGTTWTDIAGATGPTYTSPVTLANNNTQYRVKVGILGDVETSAAATLSVVADTVPPTITSVSSPAPFTNILVTFSEAMDPATTADTVVYNVIPAGGTPLSIIAATMMPDGRTVELILDPSTPVVPNTTYEVTAEGATDLIGNAIVATTAPFQSMVQSCPVPFLLEVYPTGGGTAVSGLTGHPSFPNNPDQVRNLTVFDTGPDFRDNYGARITGYFVPPVTGNYKFFVHSDDASELWLNPTGPSPAGKVKIAQETGCCNAWPAISSGLIPLEGGKVYYIEGLYKEGGGGDYMRVAASLNGDTAALTAIPAPQYLNQGAAGTVTLTQSPGNVSVAENTTATFSVTATNTFGLRQCYVWESSTDGGTTWTAIDGATGPTYASTVTLANNNTQYRVKVGILGDVETSAPVTLTVTADTTAPQVASARSDVDLGVVYVKFSEVVDAGTAEDEVNYVVSAGATTYSTDLATLLSDRMTVRLQISPMLPEDTAVTVAVDNVTDIAGTPNPVAAVTVPFRSYVFMPGFLTFEAYTGIGGAAMTDLQNLTNNAKYPAFPDILKLVRAANSRYAIPNDLLDNYGARFRGFFIPPTTGNWIIYTRSDDASVVLMNTNEVDSTNPDGAVQITQEAACCGAYMAQPDPRTSPTLTLTAGQKYYIEAIYKEGGGGDWMHIAARMEGQGVPPAPSTGIDVETIPTTMIGTYVEGAGSPTATISAQPVNASSCIVLGQVQQPTGFCVTAAGTRAGQPEPVYYQWQKKLGTNDWTDVPGAIGSCYTNTPPLSDNGALYRALVFVPGGSSVTSGEATLSVNQANTPPALTLGGDIEGIVGSGATTITGFASNILHHSIPTAVSVGYDFSSTPAGASMFKWELDAPITPNMLEDGVLKLTKAINGSCGIIYTPQLSQTVIAYSVSLKVQITPGTCCGTWPGRQSSADGMSINVANDLPNPPTQNNPGEEGAGTGLIVSLDTWDNNNDGLDAPSFELRYKGTTLGKVMVSPHIVQDPSQPARWIDVNVTVDTDGLATFSYDGTNVFQGVQLPNYTPQSNLRVGIGARTGGANANHWIDDLQVTAYLPDLTGPEAGQTVSIVTTNNNQALFTVQPSISPDGTLTFTPAAAGQAVVTVIATDTGGVQCGGSDTSVKTFLVNLTGPELQSTVVQGTGGAPDQMQFTWPATLTGYVLQSAPSIPTTGPIQWENVATQPVVQGGNYVVSVPMTDPMRFFRLVRP